MSNLFLPRWTKAHDLIMELNLRKENLEVIVRDADIALRYKYSKLLKKIDY